MARTVLFLAHKTVKKVAAISQREHVQNVLMVTKDQDVAKVRGVLD